MTVSQKKKTKKQKKDLSITYDIKKRLIKLKMVSFTTKKKKKKLKML